MPFLSVQKGLQLTTWMAGAVLEWEGGAVGPCVVKGGLRAPQARDRLTTCVWVSLGVRGPCVVKGGAILKGQRGYVPSGSRDRDRWSKGGWPLARKTREMALCRGK